MIKQRPYPRFQGRHNGQPNSFYYTINNGKIYVTEHGGAITLEIIAVFTILV